MGQEFDLHVPIRLLSFFGACVAAVHTCLSSRVNRVPRVLSNTFLLASRVIWIIRNDLQQCLCLKLYKMKETFPTGLG